MIDVGMCYLANCLLWQYVSKGESLWLETEGKCAKRGDQESMNGDGGGTMQISRK